MADFSRLQIHIHSDIPAYQQLAAQLQAMINLGELQVGDSLPTETALCAQLGISRSTVRQALRSLEDDGQIIRRRRNGTKVCDPKLMRKLNNIYNFTTEMRALGLTPSSKLLRFAIVHPDEKIARKLNVDASCEVFLIRRLRLANNEPLMLETAYIPTKFCKTLTENQLSDSLYAMISEYTGLLPGEATETYEAVSFTKEEAEALDEPRTNPALRIQRVSRNTAGEIFEYCNIIARGDRIKYQIVLKNSGIQYSRVL